jgi:nucleoside-diphosphate-sugar epimerase
VHAADVADAVLAAAERPAAAGRSYDVAGPEPLTFTELLQTAARAVASRTRFVPVPLSPVLAAARGYELLSRSPRIRAEQVRRLAEDKTFAIDDAMRDLDYAPRSFAEGIRAEARAMGLVA